MRVYLRKPDLYFSEDKGKKKFIRHSSSSYSQLNEQVLAVAANKMLANMNKQSGQLWQISADLKILGLDFALVFLQLCFSTYTNT